MTQDKGGGRGTRTKTNDVRMTNETTTTNEATTTNKTSETENLRHTLKEPGKAIFLRGRVLSLYT